MLTVFGILLLVAGAALTFAVERQVEGVDVQLVGWILMAGGGTSLIAAMLRGAALGSAAVRSDGLASDGLGSRPADPVGVDASADTRGQEDRWTP